MALPGSGLASSSQWMRRKGWHRLAGRKRRHFRRCGGLSQPFSRASGRFGRPPKGAHARWFRSEAEHQGVRPGDQEAGPVQQGAKPEQHGAKAEQPSSKRDRPFETAQWNSANRIVAVRRAANDREASGARGWMRDARGGPVARHPEASFEASPLKDLGRRPHANREPPHWEPFGREGAGQASRG